MTTLRQLGVLPRPKLRSRIRWATPYTKTQLRDLNWYWKSKVDGLS